MYATKEYIQKRAAQIEKEKNIIFIINLPVPRWKRNQITNFLLRAGKKYPLLQSRKMKIENANPVYIQNKKTEILELLEKIHQNSQARFYSQSPIIYLRDALKAYEN